MTTMTLATAVLVINEIMASNVGEVMSPAINFDSWIELYNPSEEALNLGGMYLSDDASNLKRWHMPANIGSVPAKGYKVLWLGSNDIQPTQAPFKLDCDGGTIYLSNNNGDLIVSQSYQPHSLGTEKRKRRRVGLDSNGHSGGFQYHSRLCRATP